MEKLIEEKIRDSIVKVIESKIEKESFISFYTLMKELSNLFVFSIEDVNDILYVKGVDGFRKVCTIYHWLKEMEGNRVLFFVKNDVDVQKKYEIVNLEAEIGNLNSCKTTGDLKTFFFDNIQVNIWPSLDFEWFKSHGFLSKELYEAKQQTKEARNTLIISICTLIVTTLTLFVSIVVSFRACTFLIYIGVLLFIVFCLGVGGIIFLTFNSL